MRTSSRPLAVLWPASWRRAAACPAVTWVLWVDARAIDGGLALRGRTLVFGPDDRSLLDEETLS